MTDFATQGPSEEDPRIGRAAARLVLAALASTEAEETAAASISRAAATKRRVRQQLASAN